MQIIRILIILQKTIATDSNVSKSYVAEKLFKYYVAANYLNINKIAKIAIAMQSRLKDQNLEGCKLFEY